MFEAIREQLLANAERYAELAARSLPPGLDGEAVMERLNARARQSRALMENNDALIGRYLRRVLDDPHGLTDEQADELFDFALRLYEPLPSVDIALSLALHEALLARARRREDVARTVLHLHWVGCILCIWGRDAFGREACDVFGEVVGFSKHFSALDIPRARTALVNDHANLCVSLQLLRRQDPVLFFMAYDIAENFWHRPEVQAEPTFSYAELREWNDHTTALWAQHFNDGELLPAPYMERVRQSCHRLLGEERRALLFEKQTLAGAEWDTHQLQAAINACITEYYTGRLPLADYHNLLERIYEALHMEDYTRMGMNTVMDCLLRRTQVAGKLPGLTPEARRERMQMLGQALFAYVGGIPGHAMQEFYYHFDEFQAVLSLTQADVADRREYIGIVLRSTTHSHFPTYVHSLMVARLMRLLARYFIENEPEQLVGMCGAKTAAEVAEQADAICDEVYLAGLAHDVGKVVYIDTVSRTSRRLTDREFKIIRQHPAQGHMVLDRAGFGCIPHVVLGHHKWYDGSRGYPEDFDNTASPWRFVIDLCAVADSIDAATDHVGRGYAPTLTVGQVLAEIAAQAGTRYSPAVARAVATPALRAKIEDALRARRPAAYRQAYWELGGLMAAPGEAK